MSFSASLQELAPWLITAYWLLRLGWFLRNAKRPEGAPVKWALLGRLHFAGLTFLFAVEMNRG